MGDTQSMGPGSPPGTGPQPQMGWLQRQVMPTITKPFAIALVGTLLGIGGTSAAIKKLFPDIATTDEVAHIVEDVTDEKIAPLASSLADVAKALSSHKDLKAHPVQMEINRRAETERGDMKDWLKRVEGKLDRALRRRGR